MVVDRRVSPFLSVHSFISLRTVCHTHYRDQNAWFLRSNPMPVHVPSLSMREILALNYLLSWAMQFPEQLGSEDWYQRVMEWLEHNSSIRIMHHFFMNQDIDKLDLTTLSLRRRFVWQRQWHQHRRLYKMKARKRILTHAFTDEYPSKRRKSWVSSTVPAQPCC
jgi:hypothetical protein